jgi:hypothetical protein
VSTKTHRVRLRGPACRRERRFESLSLWLGTISTGCADQQRHIRNTKGGGHGYRPRTPGRDYPIGETYQPDEPPLQMTVEQLRAVRDAAASVADKPGVHVFDDFIIFHGKCRSAMPRYLARFAWSQLRSGIAGLHSH